MTKSINLLTNVQTNELSLVKRGANNKRFALTKEHPMKIAELLNTVLSTKAEGEDALVATMKTAGASEDALEVAVANFRLQAGFSDKLSKSEFAEVVKAAGYVTKAENPFAPEEDEDEKKKKEEADAKAKAEADKEKAAKSLPADMPAEMKKAYDEQATQLEAVRKEAADAAAEVTKLRKEAERRDYIQKCEENFSHVPGMSTEEMGDMLQKAYEVSEDFGQNLEKQWAATSEAISKSDLLQNAGGSSVSNSSAHGKLESIAKEYVKSNPDMGMDVAFAKAMENNPKLYDEYLNDNPSQRGG